MGKSSRIRRTSKPAWDGAMMLAMLVIDGLPAPGRGQLREQVLFERLPEPVDPDSVEHVTRERVDQHVTRLLPVEAPRPQIKDRVLIELSYCRAVRALHVVCEDLELRLRIDLRIV